MPLAVDSHNGNNSHTDGEKTKADQSTRRLIEKKAGMVREKKKGW